MSQEDTFTPKTIPKVINNYVNGQFIPSQSGETIDNYSPRDGKFLNTIPSSNEDDVNKAADAAEKAFQCWRKKSWKERCDILTKIADRIEKIEAETGIFSYTESIDCGKPITLAKTLDIPRVIDNFRYFASLGQHEAGKSWIVGGSALENNNTAAVNYSQRFPIGVCGLIVPWNLPLYLLTWKLAPALLCGNAIVIKCSEFTPSSANLLMILLDQLFKELNENNIIVPTGLINICHGYGHTAGDAIVKHPKIKMISFTGGSVTGSIIGANCGKLFKRVSLELGGKNTAAIFEDCNIDTTIKIVARSMFLNQGEICLCNSRLLIQETIYDEFITRLKDEINLLFQPSDPALSTTTFGALISKQHKEKVLSYINIATEQGGEVIYGGNAFPSKLLTIENNENNDDLSGGYYVQPTLITNVKPTDRLAQEEVFGPVIAIMKFKTEEEAIEIHNNTMYGLAGSLFTSDGKRMHRYSHAIETGMIWVNTWMMRNLSSPFGGIRHSGNVVEGGEHSLDTYSYIKNVCIKL